MLPPLLLYTAPSWSPSIPAAPSPPTARVFRNVTTPAHGADSWASASWAATAPASWTASHAPSFWAAVASPDGTTATIARYGQAWSELTKNKKQKLLLPSQKQLQAAEIWDRIYCFWRKELFLSSRHINLQRWGR